MFPLDGLFSLQLPEFAAQASLTGLMIFTGNWVSGILQLAALGYNIKQVRKKTSCLRFDE